MPGTQAQRVTGSDADTVSAGTDLPSGADRQTDIDSKCDRHDSGGSGESLPEKK